MSDKGKGGSDSSSSSSGSKGSSPSGGVWIGADAVRGAVDTASGMLGDRTGSNSGSSSDQK